MRIRTAGVFALFAAGYCALLLLFPQKLQTVESYAYAMAIEGYYDLSQTFTEGQPGMVLPNFARYHPNHPAVHWISGKLYDHFSVPGYASLRFFSILGATLTLWFVFCSAMLLWRKTTVALAVAAMAAFSHVFWAAALSAEVHLSSVWLLTAAMYFLLRYLLTDNPRSLLLLGFCALLFVAATAFHLYSLFAAISAGAALLYSGAKRWRSLALAGVIVASGFVLFYVVLMVVNLNLETPRRYFDTMLMYTRLTHARYYGADWFVMWLKTALQSLVYGFSAFSIAIKVGIGGFICVSAILFLRSGFSKSVKILLLGWPLVYILLNVVFGGRADGINGWLFSLPVMAIFCGAWFSRLHDRPEWRMYSFLVPALLAAANFFLVVRPASLPADRDIRFLYDLPQKAQQTAEPAWPKDIAVVFAVGDPVLTFADMWQMGSGFGWRQQKLILFCCGSERPAERLAAVLAASSPPMLLISDDLAEQSEEILRRSKRQFRLVMDNSGELAQVWMPSSIYFTRPPNYRVLKRIRVWHVQ